MLNVEQLSGLLEATGVAVVKDIIDAYHNSCDQLIELLQQSLQNGDLENAATTAHALKGASLNVGADALSVAVRAFEIACQDAAEDELNAALENVLAKRAETKTALDTFLANAA